MTLLNIQSIRMEKNENICVLKVVILQGVEYPPAPSDASDVVNLLAHQNVIASSHPDGSYFMTQEGQCYIHNI